MPKNKGLKKSIRNISDFLKSDSSKINAKLLYRSTERKEVQEKNHLEARKNFFFIIGCFIKSNRLEMDQGVEREY